MFIFFKKKLALIHYYFNRAWSKLVMSWYKPLFLTSGENIIFDPINSNFSYRTIELGHDIFIGKRAWFSGEIYIGNYVMFGPSVTILDGDHEYKNMDMPMFFVKENSSRKAKVWINDDVWIGANVTILKGVTIGKGAIVAAGSLVNKNVQEFSIVGGVPAKILSERFDTNERSLYLEMLNKYKNER